MFNSNFYPTPSDIARKMIKSVRKTEAYERAGREIQRNYLKYPVLEPSAGKGDILDTIESTTSSFARVKDEIYAIEIEPELRSILTDKGYKVIGTDFLEYSEPITFNTILMNPPFSNGANHIIHAWQFLRDSGTLVALCNLESISNPYSQIRKNLVELINQYGHYENLGDCFSQSERKTNVNVALIVLTKPEKEQEFEFNSSVFQHDDISEENIDPSMLAQSDAIKDLVSRYNGAVNVLKERDRQQKLLNVYLSGIEDSIYDANIRKDSESLKQDKDFNSQIMALKSRFWATVFQKTRIEEFATSKVKEKFSLFARQQSNLAFTENNIKSLLEMFFLNRKEIMMECLCDTFDKATRYHEKNLIHHEGWKTNKASRLNDKIIVPNGVEFSFNHFSTNHWVKIREFLNDMDKCLCYLSGKTMEQNNGTHDQLREICYRANQEGYQQEFDTTFFKIRIFKKGTVHLKFKDENLLRDFNKAVSEGRKWIGSDY